MGQVTYYPVLSVSLVLGFTPTSKKMKIENYKCQCGNFKFELLGYIL